MVTILKERFRSFENERSVVVAELAVDEKTDLPSPAVSAEGCSHRALSPGK